VPAIRVGVSVTKAAWGADFRGYVQDHASGISLDTLVEPSHLPQAGQRALDVLIIDDLAQIFHATDVRSAQNHRTHVIGLWDEKDGRGRAYILGLGVDEDFPTSTAPEELVAAVLRVGAINAGTGHASSDVDDLSPPTARRHRPPGALRGQDPRTPRGAPPTRRATVSVLMSVSGGTGRSEALIAAGERLARKSRVLVIEAGDSSLAHRLRRTPEGGLNYSLERVSRNQLALPDGLSTGRDDDSRPLGRFDVICGTPGTPPPQINAQLVGLVDEAAADYDHVVIETGPLVTAPTFAAGDRLGAARALLSRTDQIAVFAGADPTGAIKLVEWMSTFHSLAMPLWTCAIFGRASTRRFNRSELVNVVDTNTIPAARFDSIRFLPEDRNVEKARWDGVMVGGGRWSNAIGDLTAELAGYRSPRVQARGSRRRQPKNPSNATPAKVTAR
jgi:hypothetical protein